MTTAERITKALDGADTDDIDYATRRYDTWLRGDQRISKAAYDKVQGRISATDNSSGEGRIRPSLIWSCPRKQMLSYFDAPKEAHKLETLKIFQIGHLFHRHWQEVGISEGWMVDCEVPISVPSLGIHGSADGLMDDGSVFELKTTSGWFFEQLDDQPFENHYMQVQLYMHALDARKASIVYVNKDLGKKLATKEFRVAYDPAAFSNAIVPRVQAVRSHIEQSHNPNIVDGSNGIKLPIVDVDHQDCKARKNATYNNCEYKEVCAPELSE